MSNASFSFAAGETTFVIGRSGSGKSTLSNLLLQFYTPAIGDILIDDESIRVLDINWLRNNITLVQQQSVIFNDSVFKNIAFGHRDYTKVTKAEIKKSIELSALKSTIMDLPRELDTVVGTGGSTVSGGQRQRIAIARARLRDTPILVLDEATSALDHISRTEVMEAIRLWRKGKTTIIITHDISQILDEDYVYVMDKACVVQEGFRSALEKETAGPFAGFLSPLVQFPTTRAQGVRRSERQRSFYSNLISASPRASTASDDSMDIRTTRTPRSCASATPSRRSSSPRGTSTPAFA